MNKNIIFGILGLGFCFVVILVGATVVYVANNSSPASSNQSKSFLFTIADKGKSVTVSSGDQITVQLDSTYWTFDAIDNTNVVKQQGNTSYKGQLSPVPGSGTGTATADFVAISPGTTKITASRVSCGEALRCTGDQGSFEITVTVK